MKAGGKPHLPYTVFVKARTNLRAVVVSNPSDSKELLCNVNLPSPRRLRLVTPEEPDARDFTGQVRIPAEGAAVVLEF